MTIFQMLAALIIGAVLLAVGISKRNKWIMLASAIPLLIVAVQIVMLAMMAVH